MAKEEFEVIRAHIGDKSYNVGDKRIAEKADVAHLIGRSLRKAAGPVENKAAPRVQNKSQAPAANK